MIANDDVLNDVRKYTEPIRGWLYEDLQLGAGAAEGGALIYSA